MKAWFILLSSSSSCLLLLSSLAVANILNLVVASYSSSSSTMADLFRYLKTLGGSVIVVFFLSLLVTDFYSFTCCDSLASFCELSSPPPDPLIRSCSLEPSYWEQSKFLYSENCSTELVAPPPLLSLDLYSLLQRRGLEKLRMLRTIFWLVISI